MWSYAFIAVIRIDKYKISNYFTYTQDKYFYLKVFQSCNEIKSSPLNHVAEFPQPNDSYRNILNWYWRIMAQHCAGSKHMNILNQRRFSNIQFKITF